MKVFVVGGSGFIGSSCARAFAAAGCRVTALSRSNHFDISVTSAGCRTIQGDMTREGPWLEELAAADVVIYAAQVRAGKRLTKRWIEECRAARDAAMNLILPRLERERACKAFIYTSGIVAVGDHGEREVTELTARVSSIVGDFHAESEALMLAAVARGTPCVVLRPGFVYGPAGVFAEFFIKEALKGFYPYPGNGENFLPWVDVDDLAQAYVLAARNPPIGQIIHVVDDAPIRLAEFARLLVQAAGGGRTMGMPKWLVSLIAGAPLVEMLTSSYRARNDNAKQLLGWRPMRATVASGLPEVISAYAAPATFAEPTSEPLQ